MSENNPLKVVFAPGCFDQFEGTQEELDALVAEIKNIFDGKTEEELEELLVSLDEDILDDLDDEDQEELLNWLNNSEQKRTLN